MYDDQPQAAVTELLDPAAVRLTESVPDRLEAVRRTGDALVDCGAVDRSYVTSMLEREASVSTYLGQGVAIPHGTPAATALVHREALSFLRFDPPVDWDGAGEVTVAIGIAATGGRHVGVLAELTSILLDPCRAAELRAARSVNRVLELLATDRAA